ncbi:MAG: porin [Gammaproteobacteria bacterium]|nr:porin [Gammaproteobacteria bacterium]
MIKRIHIVLSCTICALFTQPVLALNLDIWGLGHLSVDRADNGTDDSTFVASNSSRLAVSGDQDLDNGISIIFQYESGVDLTGRGENDGNGGADSSGQLFTRTRDAFVGISGGFGKAQVGRMGGLNEWVYDFNLFADQVGDLGNIWGGTGLFGRVDNLVRYTTPDFAGFNIGLSYAPEEGVDDSDVGVIKANYANEGLKFGAAFMSQGTGSTDEHEAAALTGSYNFGMFTIGAGYQDESDIGGIRGNDRDGFTVGASVAIGNGTIKGQVTQTNGDGSETDATQWAVGYDHNIGKNTTVYIAYAKTDNDANTSFSANNYGHGDDFGAGVPGDDPDVISVGLVYSFRARVWPR